MNLDDLDRIAAWLTEQGLAGADETALLHGFCEHACRAGLALSRAIVVIDTLHPVYEGRAFRWRNDGVEEEALIEYGRTTKGEAATNWQASIFFHMLTHNLSDIRRRLAPGEPSDFKFLAELASEGHTDVIAFVQRFTSTGTIGEMDCVYSYWVTREPGGFSECDVAALRRLLPTLALASKCASLNRIAGTLVSVYLGRDAGQRVLDGRIARGVADRISAVLWFSDLRGYTRITDTAPPEEIIPLLNDYSQLVISAIHETGGDVLKLIGDGTLAIFKADVPGEACRSALKAEASLRHRLKKLNARREAEGRPTTSTYIGLHIGDVFYGNIGSEQRLDFTVVGPAVNEASRIASMCRAVDRHVVLSADFAAATPEPERQRLVSVGRYALRGVSRAQELFTLDPALL